MEKVRKSCQRFIFIVSKIRWYRDVQWWLNPESYSSWIRLVSVNAQINRFVNNCKINIKDSLACKLSAEEVDETGTLVIRLA